MEEKKSNELAISIEKCGPNEDGNYRIEVGILIDEEPYGPDFAVNAFELAKSCQISGEMEIFTCGCGVAGCAGIFDGIRVTHTETRVEWLCPNPLAAPDSDEEYPAAWIQFCFDPKQYAAAITEGLRRFIGMIASESEAVEFPALGKDRNAYLELETAPFSHRDCYPGQKIVARTFVVEAYIASLIVGGNAHPIEGLNIPEHILGIYREMKSLHVFPSTQEDLPGYVAYLDACRRFCTALRRFLEPDIEVRLSYHPPKVYNAYAWTITETIR